MSSIKRHHSSSLEQPIEETPKEFNESLKRCIEAADLVGLSRNGSYQGARECMLELYTRMMEIQDGNIVAKYLMAPHIISCLKIALTGECKHSNQIEGVNDRARSPHTLSDVIWRTLRWSQQIKSEQSTTIEKSVKEVIELWNKTFSPKLSLVRWPKKSGSCVSQHISLYGPPDVDAIEFDIMLEDNRQLRHATSVKNAISILCEISERKIQLITESGLVWCGVALKQEEIDKITHRDAKRHATTKRYGSVLFTFPVMATPISSDGKAYIMGTRVFQFEHSQVILIPKSNSYSPFYSINDDDTNLQGLDQIAGLRNQPWNLRYGTQNWTHPELAFEGDLSIEVSEIKITFQDHSCPTEKKSRCDDCKNHINTKELALQRFKTQLQNSKEHLRQCFCDEDYRAIFSSE